MITTPDIFPSKCELVKQISVEMSFLGGKKIWFATVHVLVF